MTGLALNPRLCRWWAVAAATAFGCGAAPATPTPGTEGRSADPLEALGLPDQARWRQHVTEELMPFWTHADALGVPAGNYPTFRCNDGSAYRADAPCPELAEPAAWIASELGAEYTRMKSRQAFTYGVGFHVTGDPALLAHARAGVEWLREHAYDRDSGSAVSVVTRDGPGPPIAQRTSQDLAYAQLGLGFYYYLTRDREVLSDLLRLKAHVFDTYWDPSIGMLRWVREDGPGGTADRLELVAQLDQINAYLLLLAPILPEREAAAWRRDLHRTAEVIQDRFFAEQHGLFWGMLDSPETKLGGRHTDFGHSSKALWMLYLTGQLVGDDDMVEFARARAGPLLERAAQPSGCWASEIGADGTIGRDSQWWVFAELDQTAATLALREPDQRDRYARLLAPSYRCWFERFVDREHHEVWPFVPADWQPDTFARRQPLKQFHWKSGYHSLEHALIALITTAGLAGQPVTLYYAFRDEVAHETIQPYLFAGTIANTEDVSVPGARGVRVTFRDLR